MHLYILPWDDADRTYPCLRVHGRPISQLSLSRCSLRPLPFPLILCVRLMKPSSPVQGLDAKTTGAYMCGPQPFMDAATSALQELGFPGDHIYSESFNY